MAGTTGTAGPPGGAGFGLAFALPFGLGLPFGFAFAAASGCLYRHLSPYWHRPSRKNLQASFDFALSLSPACGDPLGLALSPLLPFGPPFGPGFGLAVGVYGPLGTPLCLYSQASPLVHIPKSRYLHGVSFLLTHSGFVIVPGLPGLLAASQEVRAFFMLFLRAKEMYLLTAVIKNA